MGAEGYPSAPFALGGVLSELSIFVDESGGQGGHSEYCGITLVFHSQESSIDGCPQKHRRGSWIAASTTFPCMRVRS